MSATAWPCTASPNIPPTRRRPTTSIPTRPRAAASSSVRRYQHLRLAASLHHQGRAGGRASASLWETLCWHARDEAFTVYGMIAETIEWPEDRSWVAFTLRPQAKWHDGTPITVEDVVWSFDTLKAKGSPTLRHLLCRRAEGREDRRSQGAVHLPRQRQPRAAADRRLAADPAVEMVGRQAISRRCRSSRRWAAAPTRSTTSMSAAPSPIAACRTGGPRISG